MRDAVARLIELVGAGPRVAVAFSGGVDSTVLAHALSKQRRRLRRLRLVHVDHGLQAASGEWSRQCARVARAWRVPFVGLRANIERARGISPEAAARDARYALLAAAMEPGEVLVTAQHRDDQVETLLLQLLRGAGVSGLAAMPAIAPFGPGCIVRPLLDVSRAELEAYARAHGLAWLDDPSNLELRFARNFLRHRVLPVIREQWPGADRALARSAAHMAEARELLGTVAAADLASAADGDALNAAALRRLPLARRRNALRAFIARAGVELPETARLQEISRAMLDARADAQPEVRWNGAVMRRRLGRVELSHQMPAAQQDREQNWNWRRQARLQLGSDGAQLQLIDDAAGPIDLALLPARLIVRTRRGGERLRPSRGARLQDLKKLLQAGRVPAEQRARMPLVFDGERLIAAGDRWVDASVRATAASARRARLRWHHAAPQR